MKDYEARYCKQKQKELNAFFQLRLLLAPLVENIILLDRLVKLDQQVQRFEDWCTLCSYFMEFCFRIPSAIHFWSAFFRQLRRRDAMPSLPLRNQYIQLETCQQKNFPLKLNTILNKM